MIEDFAIHILHRDTSDFTRKQDVLRLKELYHELKLDKDSPAGPFSEGYFREQLMRGNWFFFGIINGTIVATATLVLVQSAHKRYGIIHDVVVDEPLRGYGLSKRLLEEVIATGKELNLKYLELTSRPRRIDANAVYQGMGFQVVANAMSADGTHLYRLELPQRENSPGENIYSLHA